MKKFAMIATALLVAACAETTTTPKVPTIADQFLGKTLVAGDATFVFNEDGTVGGNTGGGEAIEGTYTANDTQICSSYTAPPQLIGLGQICSVPAVDGNTVQFNRTNGSQSPVYTIEG